MAQLPLGSRGRGAPRAEKGALLFPVASTGRGRAQRGKAGRWLRVMCLSPGIGVGPARGCQGEPSDSGAGGRLRGRSETWRGNRRKDPFLTRPVPPRGLPPTHHLLQGGPWRRYEIGVGLHEKNLGSSNLTSLKPKSKSLCSFTLLHSSSTNKHALCEAKTNLTSVSRSPRLGEEG